MDAEFMLVSNDTKNSIKKQKKNWEMAIFPKGTQNGQFWPKCKGGTVCKTLDFGHFFWPNFVRLENCQYSSDLSLICMDGSRIYSIF